MSTSLPSPVGALLNATLASGEIVDVVIDADRVSRVLPAGSALPPTTGEIIDLTGFLLVTAPAEPHGHLDKSQSFDIIDPPLGDLDRAVESWHTYSGVMTEADVFDRARSTALRMLAHGTTTVRTHVDLLPGDDPLRGVRALVRLRDELQSVMELELVALGGWQTGDDVFEAALDEGLDLVGGAPHMAPDPQAELERLLLLAQRRGVGVDLHTDESLDGAITLREYARTVSPWTVKKAAGHCVRLGTLEAADLDPIVADVAEAGVGIIALPITNLYLQGWQHEHSVPRGLTAVRALLDAGVPVAGGADNVRDPFNPVGRGDALETASLLVSAGHLTPAEALHAVTDGARAVMQFPEAGPVEGAVAELLAVRALNVGEAVAFAPGDRLVIHRGVLVSRSTVSVDIAPTAAAVPATLLTN